MESGFIDLQEFCRLTGWSKNTAYQYLSKIDCPSYRFGRLVRFKRDEVIDFIDRKTTQIEKLNVNENN